jgi:YD repeat-containing protein
MRMIDDEANLPVRKLWLYLTDQEAADLVDSLNSPPGPARRHPRPRVRTTAQNGMVRATRSPTPTGGYGVVTEQIYDTMGRVVAARTRTAAGATGACTCTTYDGRGRVTKVVVPATTDDSSTTISEATPARTVTNAYSVSGTPLVTSVTDAAGTITTKVDMLGRVISYTDVEGTVTTSAYNTARRMTSQTTTGSGGGTSTEAFVTPPTVTWTRSASMAPNSLTSPTTLRAER